MALCSFQDVIQRLVQVMWMQRQERRLCVLPKTKTMMSLMDGKCDRVLGRWS